MSKIKQFMNKPVTWGGYFKLCGICTGLSLLTTAAMYAYFDYKSKQPISDLDFSLNLGNPNMDELINKFSEDESE